MAGFLARRLLNYLVLIIVAASLAYMLAASALDPRIELRRRTPRCRRRSSTRGSPS